MASDALGKLKEEVAKLLMEIQMSEGEYVLERAGTCW